MSAHPSSDNAIAILREKANQANELYRLRDRVEELEQLLGLVSDETVDRFVAFKISPTERLILNVLFTWKLVRRENLFTLLYGNRLECDQPDIKLLDIYVCRLRKYLSRLDIAICTQKSWSKEMNGGWFMTPEDKEKLSRVAEQMRDGKAKT